MFWVFYEMAFWLALICASPYYMQRMRRRGGYGDGFLERFGFFSREKRVQFKDLRPVWIHAVSVGEVQLALKLIERLRRELPAQALVLSVTTSTGHALAMEKL